MNAIVKGFAVAVGLASVSAYAGAISFENGFENRHHRYVAETRQQATNVTNWLEQDARFQAYAFIARGGAPGAAPGLLRRADQGGDNARYFRPQPGPVKFDLDQDELLALLAQAELSLPKPVVEMGKLRFSSVPEPGTLALFGIGLLGLAYARHHQHSI